MLTNQEITIAILSIYLLLLLFIGWISSKKLATKEDYFLANRSLGRFALTATITATAVGGSATIATAKLVYLYGLPAIWLDLGAVLGLIILGLTLAKIVRKTGLYTLPEITGHLFDEKVRYISSILVIITQIAWVSLLIQGAGTIIKGITSIDYLSIIVIITIIFIAYTIIGGQYAVVYTDIIQFLVMIVGVCLISAPMLFLKTKDSWGQISPEFFKFPTNEYLGILPVFSFFFMMMMPHIVGPDIYSKILSAKDERTAKYATIYSGITRMIFAMAILVIAISATILTPGLTESNAHFALPYAILELGPIISGILLASFISIMLSSADSILISAGSIINIDIIRKENINTSKIGMILIGLLSLMLAIYFNDIINTLKFAYTVFTSGLTFPIIFGFYKQKTHVTTLGAMTSLILGGTFSIIWIFLENPYGIDALIIGMISSIIPLIILRDWKK